MSVGGQIPNTLAMSLHNSGLNLLGTHSDNIDQAEDREKYSNLMKEIGVDQPAWSALTSVEAAHEFCQGVGCVGLAHCYVTCLLFSSREETLLERCRGYYWNNSSRHLILLVLICLYMQAFGLSSPIG